MVDYSVLAKRCILENIFNKMSDDEKRLFFQYALFSQGHNETVSLLRQQDERLRRIEQNQNWKVDFLSDVGANLLTDTLWILGKKLLRLL